MKIVIAIATTGRAPIVQQTLARLVRLDPPPDRVVVVGAQPADVAGLSSPLPLTVELAEKGLCRQRNRALQVIGASADVVAFIDDDFVPASGFTAGIERLFRDHPDVVAATGRMIADGIASAGLSFETADALISEDERRAPPAERLEPRFGAYGCNMVIRRSAADGLAFDENLPLYGWQEDIDFSGQLARRGRVVWTNLFAGVHLGVKQGRTSGARLGYSQVVNPIYLARKGTFPWRPALALVARNLAANAVLSFAPEPYVDRRGRLLGNLIALRELISGKAHPTRILTLGS
jgi:GT2 family glycosyltransferase